MKEFDFQTIAPKTYGALTGKYIDEVLDEILDCYSNGKDFWINLNTNRFILVPKSYRNKEKDLITGLSRNDFNCFKDYLVWGKVSGWNIPGKNLDENSYRLHRNPEERLSEEDAVRIMERIRLVWKEKPNYNAEYDVMRSRYDNSGMTPLEFQTNYEFREYKGGKGIELKSFRTIQEFWRNCLGDRSLINKRTYPGKKLCLENMILMSEVPAYPSAAYSGSYWGRIQPNRIKDKNLPGSTITWGMLDIGKHASRIFGSVPLAKLRKVEGDEYTVLCLNNEESIIGAVSIYVKNDDEILDRVGERIDSVELEVRQPNYYFILNDDYALPIIYYPLVKRFR